MLRWSTLLVLMTAAACADGGTAAAPSGAPVPALEAAAETTTSTPEPDLVRIPYRVENRAPGPDTAGFEAVVDATLLDPQGWVRAGFVFEKRPDAPYLIVLAEGPEVDALCLPYDTYGRYSCQNGPVVALNADRWRTATPQWTGDLETYRLMLVNHEVGHLVGQHHPDVQCPGRGERAPIMAQQSTELDGCLPNPWPLDHEIERAARHDLKIAPGYGE